MPEEKRLIYEFNDGRQEKTFGALDWLMALGSDVPNNGKQMVRYYGITAMFAAEGAKKKMLAHPGHTQNVCFMLSILILNSLQILLDYLCFLVNGFLCSLGRIATPNR